MPDFSSQISVRKLQDKVQQFVDCPTTERAENLEKVIACYLPAHQPFLETFARTVPLIEFGFADYSFAARCAKQAVKTYGAEAAGTLAWYTQNGLGIAANPMKAFELYLQSNKQEDHFAAIRMILKNEVRISSEEAINILLPHLKESLTARVLYARILEKYESLELAMHQAEIAFNGDGSNNLEMVKFLALAKLKGTYQGLLAPRCRGRFQQLLKHDPEGGTAFLAFAARKDPEAALILGQYLVKEDQLDEGIDILRRARLLGDSQADLELGRLYFRPEIHDSPDGMLLIEENFSLSEAETALKRARQKNYLDSSRLLGFIASEHERPTEQRNFFQEAAFADIPLAQKELGVLLSDTENPDRQVLVEAAAWLTLAHKRGVCQAGSLLEDVTFELDITECNAVPDVAAEIEKRIRTAIKPRIRFRYFEAA